MKKQMCASGGTLQNKLGFTLIELLAVIVILAIIALIATPIVLNIIKDSRESAGLRSAEMYLDAVEQAVALEKMKNTSFNPNECTITEKGNLDCDTKDGILEVKVNGDKPVNGKITFENGKTKDVTFEYSNRKIIVKNDKGNLVYNVEESENDSKLTYTSLDNYQHKSSNGKIENHEVTFDSNGHGTCSKCEENVLVPGLYSEDGTMTMNWEDLINNGEISVIDGVLTCAGEHTHGPNAGAKYDLAGILVIDDSITKIGDSAFGCGICTTTAACLNLKKIIIPNSVTEIGNKAFYACKGLISVNIPNSITSIGINAFSYCSSLTSIVLPSGITSISEQLFFQCIRLKSIEMLGSVTSIGDSAFAGCIDLASITIPASVTNIGRNAFSSCKSLKSIELPNGITSIAPFTFQSCENLKSIIIPNSVTSIGIHAFEACKGLTSIYIPKNVITIDASNLGSNPFRNSSSNLKIYTGVKEGEIPSGWGQYWNYYSETGTLSVIYDVTKEEYEATLNGA